MEPKEQPNADADSAPYSDETEDVNEGADVQDPFYVQSRDLVSSRLNDVNTGPTQDPEDTVLHLQRSRCTVTVNHLEWVFGEGIGQQWIYSVQFVMPTPYKVCPVQYYACVVQVVLFRVLSSVCPVHCRVCAAQWVK